jgi:plastocyanin
MKIVTTVLAAVLVLAGCGGSSDDESASGEPTGAASTSAAPSPSASASPTAAEDGTRVQITIEDGTVTPRGERVEVKKGQKITLVVTSDADEEIHVHSDPEHTYQVKAGGPIEESFTLDTPGQVAVEAHHLDATIVQLVVR